VGEFGVAASFGEGGRPAHQVFEPGPGVIVVNGLLGPEGAVGRFSSYVGGPASPGPQAIFFTPGTPLPLGVVGTIGFVPEEALRHQAAFCALQQAALRTAGPAAGPGSVSAADIALLLL